MSSPAAIGLAITTFNEAGSIDALCQSLSRQTVAPASIVFCDAGSTDGTVERLRSYADQLPLTVIVEPGVSIAQGRNVAIQHMQTPYVAVTDAGCVAEPQWLEQLQLGFRATPEPAVVSGWYVHVGTTLRERAFALLHQRAPSYVDPKKFLPSSRSVAFRRDAWAAVGGYPEWLTFAAEDTLFGQRLRERGYQFAFAPNAVVAWRMRTSFRSLLKQYYRYGYGDAEARLEQSTFMVKSGVILGALVCIWLGLAVTWLVPTLMVIAVCVAIAARLLRSTHDIRLVALGIAGQCTTFFGQYVGYITGLIWGHRKP